MSSENAEICSQYSACSNSTPTATKTPSKDIIVVPQAPNNLSQLCSPNHIQQKGLAACQHACEPASCCMEEDEELNCMNMSSENVETCSQYSACVFLSWRWNTIITMYTSHPPMLSEERMCMGKWFVSWYMSTIRGRELSWPWYWGFYWWWFTMLLQKSKYRYSW